MSNSNYGYSFLKHKPNTSGLCDLLNSNTPKKTITSSQLAEVTALLPEQSRLPDVHPDWIQDNLMYFTDDAEAVVTFIDEGAGYKNTLGYYIFDSENPPETLHDVKSIIIIMPNASASGKGGNMSTGDSIKLASEFTFEVDSGFLVANPTSYTFTENTGVGFVIFQNGWKGWYVDTTVQKYYSDASLNPEDDPYNYHTVCVPLSQSSNSFVVGFEDLSRGATSSSDDDFNDLIIMVEVTPNESLSTATFATQANIESNSPPTEFTVGYKKVFRIENDDDEVFNRVECIAKLWIPNDAVIRSSTSYLGVQKFRTDKAYVRIIHKCSDKSKKWNRRNKNSVGKEVDTAFAHNNNAFTFTKGEWVYANGVSVNNICEEGIHFFNNRRFAEDFVM